MVSNDLSLVKLVDFGLCTPDPRDSRKMSGKTGSYRYMAPEVYLESHSYSAKVRAHILTRESILVRQVNRFECHGKRTHSKAREHILMPRSEDTF